MHIPELPIYRFIMEHWSSYGAKPALIDAPTSRTLTYADLCRSVPRVAANLAARGMKKGEVFCIYSPNVLEYPVASYGIQMAGGIPTTVNPVYSSEELHRQLIDSGATRLITVPDLLEKSRTAVEGTSVHEIFVFGEAAGAVSFAQLLEPSGPPPAVEHDLREDIVSLPYSSGTTGAAKGVMLTHYSMIAALRQIIEVEQTNRDHVVIAFLPFFHIYGMQVILNTSLRQGATLIVMSRFDFEGFCNAVQTYRINRLYLVPPVVLALSKSPVVDRYNFSSVRDILAGAAPLGETLIKACGERIGAPVRQGYGMTETSCIISIVPPGRTPPALDGVGLPVPGCEVKLVDGELLVRGPQIMKGYLNRPEATAEMVLPDGWMRTGDIAEIDEEGWIRIVDRCKELIKYKGCQVPPAELEALLLSHPGIIDAAVIGVPDEEAGEVPKAFVVRRGEISTAELSDFITARVAPFKKIRQWEFVDQIPKSPSGKILRRLLRTQ
ncbi:MAG: AMP-binding protein [Acidobacteria bacterium]|nr:AMP-binding protein [Acidobacteriota bacterium]